MRHKWHDEIVAWAAGEEVQKRSLGDVEWKSCTVTPSWGAPCFEFRIKSKSLDYRLALFRSKDLFWVAVSYEANVQYPLPENPNFVRWIGDWVKVEI